MRKTKVDLSKYDSSFSLTNKTGRLFWNIFSLILFRPFGSKVFRGWRIFVLNLFGARISAKADVYSSVKIWAPWNLTMDEFATLGPGVDCYNQGKITIGANTVISQKSYLCASSHDYTNSKYPLILKPIVIQDQVWVGADSFIGPGVYIEQGAVIGARASVFKKVESWTIVGGNPAKFIKKRELKK